MKDFRAIEQDLSSIRQVMERSVKFISLSGISGILAGIYALAGAITAYFLLDQNTSTYNDSYDDGDATTVNALDDTLIWQLISLAAIVLMLSLLTGIIFSYRKAKKQNMSLWNQASQRLFAALAIPLVTGGLLILIFMTSGNYSFCAAGTLIFYGLALVNGSQYTYGEVRYLGILEIILGLIAAFAPGYGLYLWAAGFGILHIIYGAYMYYRYEQ